MPIRNPRRSPHGDGALDPHRNQPTQQKELRRVLPGKDHRILAERIIPPRSNGPKRIRVWLGERSAGPKKHFSLRGRDDGVDPKLLLPVRHAAALQAQALAAHGQVRVVPRESTPQSHWRWTDSTEESWPDVIDEARLPPKFHYERGR